MKISKRNPHAMGFFESIIWRFFGETRIITTIGVVLFIVFVLLSTIGGAIAIHFIHKYW